MIAQPTTTVRTGTTTWRFDPAHTQLEFAVKHMMITTVRGRFSELVGVIHANEANPALSSVEVTIDVASLDTREAQRDGHLRSPDFFDVEPFPTITFKSRRVNWNGTKRFQLVGDLTIRDVTREVTLDVTYTGQGKNLYGKTIAGFTAETTIDRTDFGLTWNRALETGGWLVANDIKVTVEVQAVLQA